MEEKRKPVDEADLTEEIVETVKETMGEFHQGKAEQLAALLLGVFKIKGWEVVEKPGPEEDGIDVRRGLSEREWVRVQEMTPDEVRKKPGGVASRLFGFGGSRLVVTQRVNKKRPYDMKVPNPEEGNQAQESQGDWNKKLPNKQPRFNDTIEEFADVT